MGLKAEAAVIRLLEKHLWSLTHQRLRTCIGEIDLVFCKDNHILLIEVKKLNQDWRSFERIASSQLLKLQKNCILFSNIFAAYKIRAFVCWADCQNRISFVPIE